MSGTNNEQLLSGYYTPEQLASELKRNRRTLARWAALGEGPPITRIGNKIYYRKTSAAAWLAGLEEDAG
jgi:hypothetical protein